MPGSQCLRVENLRKFVSPICEVEHATRVHKNMVVKSDFWQWLKLVSFVKNNKDRKSCHLNLIVGLCGSTVCTWGRFFALLRFQRSSSISAPNSRQFTSSSWQSALCNYNSLQLQFTSSSSPRYYGLIHDIHRCLNFATPSPEGSLRSYCKSHREHAVTIQFHLSHKSHTKKS